MSDALSIAATGMNRSATRLQRDANDIVTATTTDTSQSGKLESAMVSQSVDATTFKANATVFNTSDKMMGALLNIKA